MEAPTPRGPLKLPLFTARATHATRVAVLGLVLVAGGTGLTAYSYFRSPYWNRVGLAPDQPVLFSHRHHVGELKIDCRFCHTTVETCADAGMPSTHTCLTCHSQLFREEPMLRPVMVSAATDSPLRWGRVNTLPDHVHFNHSIHLAKGIACVSCHGDVGTMALTAKARALTMRECLDCHRDPERHQVSAHQLFSGKTEPALRDVDARTAPPDTVPPVHREALMNCSTCHH